MSEATKKTRASRNNHIATKDNAITDAKSAQMFVEAARHATAGDKPSTMFNGSGFVTPSALDNQDAENLVRMGATINDALARMVSQNAEQRDIAERGLRILAQHAADASEIQRQARRAAVLAEAERIRAEDATANA